MASIRHRPPSFLSSLFGGGHRRHILVAGEWGRGGAGGEEDGDDDPMDGMRGDGAIGDGDDGSSSSNDDVDDDDRDINISPPPLLRMENKMLCEERSSTASKSYSSSSLGDSIFISPLPLLRMENEMLRKERSSTASKSYSSSSLGDSIFVCECDVGTGTQTLTLIAWGRGRRSSGMAFVRYHRVDHRGLRGGRLLSLWHHRKRGGGDGLGGIKRDCIPSRGDGGQGITTPIDTGGRGYDDPYADDDDDVSCVYDDRTDRWTSLNGKRDCPVEPNVTFIDALRSRSNWLVGLLALQSCSGIVLSNNEALLTEHPSIVYYLTMLVGAGGNAGNQVSVRVICGLALGTMNDNTRRRYLMRELCMALSLSVMLSAAGFVRALVFGMPLSEIYAITLSLIVYPCTRVYGVKLQFCAVNAQSDFRAQDYLRK
ncbi:hypothetical protein ACHAXA_000217 [Cyclostephanos tholiformis]|uniref:SLC41A/MgtE integral membrane domain-containing protein n=1 Tax=Cyclostephanos tholiformis TaxID=382380 RepID=A0ABD3R8D5_9STRA